jgi:hypothetical protein
MHIRQKLSVEGAGKNDIGEKYKLSNKTDFTHIHDKPVLVN